MLQPGQTLAHFRIIKRLGAGGMGEVYLVEDTKLGRKVALKILLADYFEDAERKERFNREAKTAAGISHPNVMAIHDIGSAPDPDSGQALDYIVMEYIEGEPLTTFIQQTKADIRMVMRLAEHIAAGLTAAHKVNVVHRDIKADNIIIDKDGNSKILDFGLAKPVSVYQADKKDGDADTISQELTKAGKIIGTVSYMSPEQIRGEPVDTRSDIFSFGILLYRMSTGQLPFESETQVSTLAKILEARPEPPRMKNESIPPELERIIDKCLQKDPNDRYQDTRDLVVDLRNLRRQYDSGISGVTSGITDRTDIAAARKGGTSSWKSMIPIALVGVLLVIIFWQIFSGSGSKSVSSLQAGENALAILGFDNKTGEDSLNWMQTGLPEILLTDLSQSQSMDIISRDRIIDCLGADEKEGAGSFSHPQYLKAAQSLGAKHALSGAYYRLGANIRIDARLEEIATGRIILTEKVIGTDPFSLVDSLTAKIALSLNLGDSEVTRTSVKTYTSSSPEAYKTYLDALEKFNTGFYDEAIAGFENAIKLDSTFALPYMRIGMAHVFNSHPQEGARWFARARQYQDRLPNWEATLLDIYANIWLDQKFDDAFVKMQLLVRNHPNDKESRYIYGLMLFAFTQDSTAASAQMDTALQMDPRYSPVLIWYSNFCRGQGRFEEAKDYIFKMRRYHPESPDSYRMLAVIYMRQNQLDQAAEEYKALLDRYPSNSDAVFGLVRVNILMRKFDEARRNLELIKTHHGDDHYTMADYYDNLSNLSDWQGQFRSGLDYEFKSLEQLLASVDSPLVSVKYGSIGSIYDRLDMPESTVYYSFISYEWGRDMNSVDYPIILADNDRSAIDSARTMFREGMDNLKSRLPADVRPFFDAIQRLFDATAAADTAALIKAYIDISESPLGGGDANRRMAGILCIMTGQYQKGKDLIIPYIAGEKMTSSGVVYPRINYYLGIAEEGLGNPTKAAEYYREMLKYWGKPEIELKEIKDARQRLARLTS